MTDQEQPENSTLSVYITGAATTYGLSVVRQLVAAGHSVAAHALSSKEANMLRGEGALPVYGDRADMAVTRGNMKMAEADTVIHLAPMEINTAPLVRGDRDALAAAYAKETEATLEAAKQAEIQYFVLASFAFLYADSADAVDETAASRKAGGVQLFEAALAAEQAVTEMGGCVLRVGYLYSDREDDQLHELVAQFRRGMPMSLGSAENKANWLREEDLADAVVAVTNTPQNGKMFNIVSDSTVSEYEFVSSFAEQVGLRVPRPMPGFMASNVYGKTHLALLGTNVSASNALAKSELGWTPQYGDMAVSMDDLLADVAGIADGIAMADLKAILFDLDDTLISWGDFDGNYYNLEKPRFESLRAYLTENGHDVPPVDRMIDQFRQFAQAEWEHGRETLISPHMPRILVRVLAEFDIDADEIGMDAVIGAYSWTKIQGTTVFEEVPETLETLLANDIKIGIVTNAFQTMVMRDKELEEHGLLKYFESCRFSAADVGHLKPHPAIFEAALACIGTKPEETVFVGDNLNADVAGAQRVGMKAVWRDTGYHSSRISLGIIEPDATIKRLDDMLTHLDDWYNGWRDDQ